MAQIPNVPTARMNNGNKRARSERSELAGRDKRARTARSELPGRDGAATTATNSNGNALLERMIDAAKSIRLLHAVIEEMGNVEALQKVQEMLELASELAVLLRD